MVRGPQLYVGEPLGARGDDLRISDCRLRCPPPPNEEQAIGPKNTTLRPILTAPHGPTNMQRHTAIQYIDTQVYRLVLCPRAVVHVRRECSPKKVLQSLH